MIRDATGADARRLGEIFVAAWRSGYRGVVADEVIDALDVPTWTATFAELLRANDFRTVLWCADGRALGFGRFGPDAERPPAPTGYLASLYVDPAAGGRGIGRALLGYAVTEMAAAGLTRQSLWVFAGNRRARDLYERAGFHPTNERRTDPRWGAEQLRYARDAAPSGC